MKRATRLSIQSTGAAMILLGSVGLVTSASAQDAKVEEKQRIVIMETKEGGAPEGLREFRILRDGKGELRLPGTCEHDKPAVNIDEKVGDQRTRVFICSKDGGTPAEQVARLEKARDRIVQQGDLSVEARERIRVKLDEAIARARAEQK
jgi:hypothetical protein